MSHRQHRLAFQARDRRRSLSTRPRAHARTSAPRSQDTAPARRAKVPHRARPAHCARHPLHVTLRMAPGLPSLRSHHAHRELRDALRAGAERFGFRVVHYGALSNHVHLVCEAEDGRALSRGLKGLAVRLARALNRVWKRRGALLADRYHARALATPREVRNVLAYVLNNARRHGLDVRGLLDPCSSAVLFDGWREVHSGSATTWLARARTWLLAIGWRRHGPISVHERPGGRR